MIDNQNDRPKYGEIDRTVFRLIEYDIDARGEGGRNQKYPKFSIAPIAPKEWFSAGDIAMAPRVY